MKGNPVIQKLLIAVLIVGMLVSGCTPAATPTPAPTQPPAAPAAAPTEAAPAAAPTAAPTTPPAAAPTAAQPAARTKVTIASWWDFSTSPSLQDLKKAIEAANPDLEVEFVQTAAKAYADKMLTTIAGGGEVPDVIMLAMDKVPMFADRGAILSLDNYYTPEVKSELYDSVLQALTYNGSLYAVPRSTTSQVMFLNKALFTAAKADYPADNWTWTDFRALAKKLTLTDSGGQPTQWGFYFPKYNDGFYQFLRENNGGLVSADGTKSELSKPESIEALQFLQDLILKDKSVPTESQAQQFGTDDTAPFVAGKVAMLVGGVAWMSTFETNKVEYVIRPLPTGKKQMDTSFVNAWAIPKGAKNPDISWRVMQFFASKEGQQIVLDDNMGMPANKNVDTAKFLAARDDNHYFFDALAYAEPFPAPLHGVDFFNVVEQEFSLMWLGQETVQQAVTNVEKTGNDILAGKQP
jgi:multiple sugar transport system substrate-binding protein